jgi:hypothetical protein
MAAFNVNRVSTTAPVNFVYDGPKLTGLALATGIVVVPTPDVIYQKVYDSTAGFVYYTDSVVNPTPLSTATTPNHTNALVGGTHSVIARF